MNSTRPLVSVCIQTYHHVNYIKQCLDSILKQKTNFDFEIVLGEDCSTDGTREICIEYAKKHPDIIRLFLRKREDVIYINGRPTGRFNFLENYKEARGKYIAMCEGDDYWTDDLKLQKQIDFLESNDDYVLCFHNVDVFHQHQNKFAYKHFVEKAPSKTYETKDFFRNYFIPTASVVFRKVKEFVFPDWLRFIPSFDMALYTLLSEFGKTKYLNDCMAVYRVHNKSVSSNHNNTFLLRSRIFLFENLNNHFDNQHVENLEKEVERLACDYAVRNKKKVLEAIVKHHISVIKLKIFKVNKTP